MVVLDGFAASFRGPAIILRQLNHILWFRLQIRHLTDLEGRKICISLLTVDQTSMPEGKSASTDCFYADAGAAQLSGTERLAAVHS